MDNNDHGDGKRRAIIRLPAELPPDRVDLWFIRPIRWFQLRRHPERRAETVLRIHPR